MPALTSIAVSDRESTPATHTFTPAHRKNGVSTFKNRDGVPIGDETLTISLRQSGQKYKARIVLSLPTVVTETINGVDSPSVARSNFATFETTFDASSTLQERQNTVGLMANLLLAAETEVDDVLTNLNDFY